MTQLFEALHDSALSTWVLEANSVWAFPMVLTLHTFGFMVLVGSNWALDLRLLGFGRQIPLGPMKTLFRVMWTGFCINSVTGSVLFAAEATTRGPSPLFWSKLAFVATGVTTMVLIKRELYGADSDPVMVTPSVRRLATVSLLAWLAAIVAGRLLAYVK